jgi:CHAD domain-containing protein
VGADDVAGSRGAGERGAARPGPRDLGSTRRRAKKLSKPDATDHDWHRVRIDAKQLRYSCDAVAGMFGKPARRLSKHAEALQEVLGEHQDAAIAAAVLHDMATAKGSGTVAFTLGLLHARQTDAAEAARVAFRGEWAAASRSRLRKWLGG